MRGLESILNGELDRGGDDAAPSVQEQTLHEAQLAKAAAEAEAEAASRRAIVTSQQCAEFMAQACADTRALSERAAALERTLRALAEDSQPRAALAAAAEEAAGLSRDLAQCAGEGGYAAECLRAEVARDEAAAQERRAGAAGAGLSQAKRAREEAGAAEAREEDAGSGDEEGLFQARSSSGRQRGEAMDVAGEAESEGGQPGEEVGAGQLSAAKQAAAAHDSFRERAKYIPVRLSHEERRLLRLLEAALSVSEYTDRVDVLSWRSKTGRIHAQIKDICAILCGLVVAQDYRRGQQLIAERSFADLETFFQDVFEIGRRYKIQNPDKMRDTYGKLMYMLMDSSLPEVVELLEFRCARPLRTVHSRLEEAGALALLDEPTLELATAEVDVRGASRHEVQRRIRAKERAREALARRHASSSISAEDLLLCMYSISDNNAYLAFNRDPIDGAIEHLLQSFEAQGPRESPSLAIQGGSEGARLTHSHARQYQYVLQSLTLWREISHEMFKMWYCADADMLAERNSYRLQNTGQGLQRVQSAPCVSKAMHAVLARCQRRIGSWVGSSVIHLGDHNVPNALMFIDKYTQVPRILNPVVLVLKTVPLLVRDGQLAAYIERAFGGVDAAQKLILTDFFRHAFDGSGADNFFDAGSCIDGRLTSAWAWCSKLDKKAYAPLFHLAGFTSFDGDFK